MLILPRELLDQSSEKDDSTRPRTTTRRVANNAPEAKLQIRALHSRVPAWKLSERIQALNAQPIDLARIAEVTEIQLASNDPVVVAAKCLFELSEASSEKAATGQSRGDNAASQSASGPAESKTQDAESESTEHKQSEEATESSQSQRGE